MRLLRIVGWLVVVGYLALTGYAVMATQNGTDSSVSATLSSPVVVAEEPGIVDVIAEKAPNWLELAGLLTMFASAIAAATPTPKDDGVLLIVRKVVDILAFNIGGAKPKTRQKDNVLR